MSSRKVSAPGKTSAPAASPVAIPAPAQAAAPAVAPVAGSGHPLEPASVSTPVPQPEPSPEQLALERHAAARQRLADHIATAHRNLATDIGAAKQRLVDIQTKAWKLGLERRRLTERIAEIDLDLREAEKAERIEEGGIEAYMRAQARVQPPPELA